MNRPLPMPFQIIPSIWCNRSLILQMTRRDVLGRYRGSVMGLAWSFFNPMLMLFIYTFVFSVVFKARWGSSGQESRSEFALILFIGIIVHGLFAECANRAPGLIISNVNYVKKVVFPLEILPLIALGSALFHAVISIGVLLVAIIFIHGSVPWTAIFLPIVLLPLLVGTVGLAWLLASLGVYVRDIAQSTGIITTIMLFLSPVFYPLSALPEKYRIFIQLNPLSLIIEEARKVMMWGKLPDWNALAIHMVIGSLVFCGGFWIFQTLRKGFGDVL